MNCLRCGRPVPSGEPVCPYCGEKAAAVVTPDAYVALSLKNMFLSPIVIVCILVVTVMAPWMLLSAESMSSVSATFEADLRRNINESDLDSDGYYGTSITGESLHSFSHENDFIDALYDAAGIEPSEVDDKLKLLVILMGLTGLLCAAGLWVSFYSAQQRAPRVNNTGMTIARASVITGLLCFVAVILILFVNLSSISTALGSFQEYSSLQNAANNVCTGYTLLLLLLLVGMVWYYSLLANSLKQLATTMSDLIPEPPSAMVWCLCFICAAVFVMVGLITGDFLNYLLPAAAQVVYGLTFRHIRARFAEISRSRSDLIAASRGSRIVRL